MFVGGGQFFVGEGQSFFHFFKPRDLFKQLFAPLFLVAATDHGSSKVVGGMGHQDPVGPG